ncbi:MAG: multicopper oxidase family protein [Pseudomonadota bacterium]
MKLRYLLPLLMALVPTLSFAQSSKDRPEFAQPPEVSSSDGVLNTELTVAPHDIEVGGQKVTTELYNGLFAPPTLRVRPGDKLLLNLKNRRGGKTNLHYHGTNTSPKGNSDNVFLTVEPGEDFQYEVDFPPEHPQGLFWYHPHYHGTTEYQIGSGMSGLLSVDGVLDPWPELKDITQRNMILRDIQIVKGKVPDPPDSGNPTMRTLNGQINPSIAIRPGEIQLWRIGNIGADIYYDLEVEGHKIYEIARDGIRHNQPVEFDHLLLPVSARTEFLVVGGTAGEYVFKTREIDMGPAGDPHPETVLGTLVSSGEAVTNLSLPTPQSYPQLPDLRDEETCCARTFDFSETSDGNQFCINNAGTNMNIINTNVRIGCVEEWTVNNCTAENHVFHHHQLQFQVIEKNGKEVTFTGWQDTVNLDFRAKTEEFPNRCQCDDQGNCTGCTCPTAEDPHGSVVLRVSYKNPVIEGKAVYHCHIAEHEDAGMMQVINMSRDAGHCEAGSPSSINRLSLSAEERAVCNPREHDHASYEQDAQSSDEQYVATLLASLEKDIQSSLCLAPQKSAAAAGVNHQASATTGDQPVFNILSQ